MLRVLALVLALATAPSAQEAAAFDHRHAQWTAVLQECVRDGGFDYAKLKQDRSSLDAYLAALHAVTPQALAAWTNEQRLAFWINCYNAHCVQKVIENYPLTSIRKLSGGFGLKSVFDQDFIPMRAHDPAGKNEALSLNDVQQEILRKKFKDARVHAAVVNAAVSSPALAREAYTAEQLGAQLERQMRAFVTDPARNRIDAGAKELAVSEVFKWFAEDFERDAKSVQEYLVRFARPEQAELIRAAKLRYLDYDWSLNDVKKP